MFNHWFTQVAIPGSVTKGVIALLKEGGRHVWEESDDSKTITLLKTELKILAWVLADRLQLVICDLINPRISIQEDQSKITCTKLQDKFPSLGVSFIL